MNSDDERTQSYPQDIGNGELVVPTQYSVQSDPGGNYERTKNNPSAEVEKNMHDGGGLKRM